MKEFLQDNRRIYSIAFISAVENKLKKSNKAIYKATDSSPKFISSIRIERFVLELLFSQNPFNNSSLFSHVYVSHRFPAQFCRNSSARLPM